MDIRHRFCWRAAAATSLCALASLAAAQAPPPPQDGRLLASNCFQCHGTNGNTVVGGFGSLAGKSSNDIFQTLKELAAQTDPNEIMPVHARGYTDEQLRLIANYFSTQQGR